MIFCFFEISDQLQEAVVAAGAGAVRTARRPRHRPFQDGSWCPSIVQPAQEHRAARPDTGGVQTRSGFYTTKALFMCKVQRAPFAGAIVPAVPGRCCQMLRTQHAEPNNKCACSAPRCVAGTGAESAVTTAQTPRAAPAANTHAPTQHIPFPKGSGAPVPHFCMQYSELQESSH